MEINLALICVGLVICFGGIYIKKFTSGLMGLVWGAIMGVIGVVVSALYSGGFWYLIGCLEEPEALIVVAVVALVVCFLSVAFERLCAAVNAFSGSFIILLVVVCMFAEDEEQLMLLLLAVGVASAVVGMIAYKFHDYAHMLVTAFSGAFIASVGGVGLLMNADAGDILTAVILWGNSEVTSYLLIGTFVVGCVGFAVQKNRFSGKNEENKVEHTA